MAGNRFANLNFKHSKFWREKHFPVVGDIITRTWKNISKCGHWRHPHLETPFLGVGDGITHSKKGVFQLRVTPSPTPENCFVGANIPPLLETVDGEIPST
jgi:hypothetical protein